jgi:hypothetical protein
VANSLSHLISWRPIKRKSFLIYVAKTSEKLQSRTKAKPQKKIKMHAELYNMIPNLLWSLPNLIPIGYFCYYFMPQKLLYVFLGISILPCFLPTSFFNRIQVKNLNFLKRTGVLFVQKWAQHGEIINRFIRKKYPSYKVVSNRKTMESQYKRTYGFEKFHFLGLFFFLLITIYAFSKSHYLWALVLTISNIIYNVYPILLQHYTRLKIKLLLKRSR